MRPERSIRSCRGVTLRGQAHDFRPAAEREPQQRSQAHPSLVLFEYGPVGVNFQVGRKTGGLRRLPRDSISYAMQNVVCRLAEPETAPWPQDVPLRQVIRLGRNQAMVLEPRLIQCLLN